MVEHGSRALLFFSTFLWLFNELVQPPKYSDKAVLALLSNALCLVNPLQCHQDVAFNLIAAISENILNFSLVSCNDIGAC